MHRFFHGLEPFRASVESVKRVNAITRATVAIGVLSIFFAGTFLAFTRLRPRWRRLCGGMMLKLLRIEKVKIGASLPPGRFLIAANHISYVDVLLLDQYFSPTFITSVEVAEDPLLGPVCRKSGCVFVERRNRGQLGADLLQLRERMKRGERLCLFPEGTTSDGKKILPLKSSLLQSAVDLGLQVVPIHIRYLENSVSRMPYLLGHRFFSHFLKLFHGEKVMAEVEIGQAIAPLPDRKALCLELSAALNEMSARPNQILTGGSSQTENS